MVIDRFAVYLVPLDPTVGSEMAKTRPCAVVSPDIMNRSVRTIIVAPLTTTTKGFPYRVRCEFAGRWGQVALDHLRAVDRSRLLKRLGQLDAATSLAVLGALGKMFG